MTRPLPDPGHELFAPFWAGTLEGRVLVQRCDTCATPRWPVRPICPQCHAEGFSWHELPDRGVLHTWTVVWHRTIEELPPPYAVGIVEVGGVRVVGGVVDCPFDQLRVGMRLRPVFQAVTPEVTLVQWAPASPGRATEHQKARAAEEEK
ncbi:OB-fold domain-containing protein [Dactylosporangium sp. NPDC051484]|uniref:Zn-ribbon domain-containing OB-fold protein n=1 Tax=Dactylosporangium sp. NPDC051484 TaxID=3154942 RepID=UPI00344FD13E